MTDLHHVLAAARADLSDIAERLTLVDPGTRHELVEAAATLADAARRVRILERQTTTGLFP